MAYDFHGDFAGMAMEEDELNESAGSTRWLIDSCCSYSICGNKAYFEDFKTNIA